MRACWNGEDGQKCCWGHVFHGGVLKSLIALQVCAKHAEVKQSGGIFTVTDLGSVNGTWVNDRRIKPNQPVKILPGDLIHCGKRSESHGYRVSQFVTSCSTGQAACIHEISTQDHVNQLRPAARCLR